MQCYVYVFLRFYFQRGVLSERVIRPGDITDISIVTELSPCTHSSVPQREDSVMPNLKYDLGGRTLRMATVQVSHDYSM